MRPSLLLLCSPGRALALAGLLVLPMAARADTIRVKGQTLVGTLSGISAERILFRTIYGEGTLSIAVADVEALETEGRYHVLHGDGEDSVGRIRSAGPQELVVATDDGGAERIAVSSIHSAVRSDRWDRDPLERWRAAFRYWKGSFQLGWSMKQGTGSDTSVDVALDLSRRKGPWSTFFESNYRFSVEKQQGGNGRSKLDNRVFGSLRNTYDLSERLFALASLDAEYDEVESLSLRTVPKLGMGLRLWLTEGFELSLDATPALLYQRFFGGETDDALVLGLGAVASLDLGFGSLDARADYLPSVVRWTRDYLVRTRATLSIPIFGELSFQAAVSDEYKSRPLPGNDHNRLNTSLGLGLGF